MTSSHRCDVASSEPSSLSIMAASPVKPAAPPKRSALEEDSIVISATQKEGPLVKQGFKFRKLWVTRWIKLHGDALEYFEERGRGLRGRITINEKTTVVDCGDEEFYVFPSPSSPESETWRLQASSPKETQGWVRAIQSQIEVIRWFKRYSFGRLLGTGAVGTVKEVRDLQTGISYACKMIDITNRRRREVAEREVEIMKEVATSIRHPGVIRIHKVFMDVDRVYMLQQVPLTLHCKRILARVTPCFLFPSPSCPPSPPFVCVCGGGGGGGYNIHLYFTIFSC